MRNPEIKAIKPNYRKSTLEVTLREGKKLASYQLPFSAFGAGRIGTQNPFTAISIDKEVKGQAAVFSLADGTGGSFPADFVLYHCDPSYDWSPIHQLKRALKQKLGESKLSVRVVADALRTSPSQVMRLLAENQASPQLQHLLRLAKVAGYQIEFRLRKRSAP